MIRKQHTGQGWGCRGGSRDSRLCIVERVVGNTSKGCLVGSGVRSTKTKISNPLGRHVVGGSSICMQWVGESGGYMHMGKTGIWM